MLNGEIIGYFVLLQVKALVVKFRTENKMVHIFIILQSSFWEWQEILLLRTKCCAEILWKGTNWKFKFPSSKINLHVLQITKPYFSYTSWLMISDKSIMGYMFLHYGGACNVPKVSANKSYKVILGSIEIKWGIGFIWDRLLQKHFREWLVSVSEEIQNFYHNFSLVLSQWPISPISFI